MGKAPVIRQVKGKGMNLGTKRPGFGIGKPRKPQPAKPTDLSPLTVATLKGNKSASQNAYLPPLAGMSVKPTRKRPKG